MCAKVTLFGVTSTIENWYQLSKCFNSKRPKSVNQAKHIQHKGHSPTSFFVGNREFDVKYLSSWYEMLWMVYLKQNPDLVEYAKQFDEFSDCFKRANTINCQADVIRDYVNLGRDGMVERNREFLDILMGR